MPVRQYWLRTAESALKPVHMKGALEYTAQIGLNSNQGRMHNVIIKI